MSKIGILGGTFNPVHNGHLYLAEQAIEYLSLEKLLLVPNGNPPHKSELSVSSEDRLQMLKLAVKDNPKLQIDTFELDFEGYSYTYKTLEYMKKKYPNDELYFIAGADNIDEISGWRFPERIFSLATVVFVSRPPHKMNVESLNYLKERFDARLEWFFVEGMDISATEIRRCITAGLEISKMLPQGVAEYIRENHLYQPETERYIKKLHSLLSPHRLQHTLGVAKMAEKLAKHYHYDENKAYVAGLLHDCAKNLSEEEQYALTKRCVFPVYDGELEQPQLIHSLAGSVLAAEYFGVKDAEILSAIRYHTIGRVDMSLLEKIIYIADLIEENRDFPFLPRMRELAFIDLDKAILLSLENNFNYLKEKKMDILQESYRIRDSLSDKGVCL